MADLKIKDARYAIIYFTRFALFDKSNACVYTGNTFTESFFRKHKVLNEC